MDTLGFAASLVNSLAWPAVAVIAVITFRKPVEKLMDGRLKRVSIGPLEAELFEKRIESAKELVESAPPIEKTDDTSNSDVRAPWPDIERLSPLAQSEPRAAVLIAWLEVEHEMRALVAKKLGRPVTGPTFRLVQQLTRDREIDPAVAALYNDLRGLRNQATHNRDFAVSSEAADDYLDLCAVLLYWTAIREGGSPKQGTPDPVV